MIKSVGLLFICCISAWSAIAQLPIIKVISVKGRSIVSFQNQYPNLMSVTLERSNDSTKNFLAINTLNAPKKGENVIIDENPFVGKNYYRLHIYFNKDVEWYSNKISANVLTNDTSSTAYKSNDTVITSSNNGGVSTSGNIGLIKDSVATVFQYTPSTHVFNNSYTGHINIKLPDAKSKRYSLTFFNIDKKQVLHIDRISNPSVILDKRNINYKGIIKFSLQESGVEIEKGYVELK
jgi:hypothetical protein